MASLGTSSITPVGGRRAGRQPRRCHLHPRAALPRRLRAHCDLGGRWLHYDGAWRVGERIQLAPDDITIETGDHPDERIRLAEATSPTPATRCTRRASSRYPVEVIRSDRRNNGVGSIVDGVIRVRIPSWMTAEDEARLLMTSSNESSTGGAPPQSTLRLVPKLADIADSPRRLGDLV